MPLSFPSFSHLERNTNETKKWRFWAFWVYRQYSKESGRWVGSLNKWFQKFFIYYPGVDDTFLFSYIFVDTPSWQSSECFYLLDVLKSALFQFKFPWWSVRLSFSIFIYLCFPFPLKYIFIYFATWETCLILYWFERAFYASWIIIQNVNNAQANLFFKIIHVHSYENKVGNLFLDILGFLFFLRKPFSSI